MFSNLQCIELDLNRAILEKLIELKDEQKEPLAGKRGGNIGFSGVIISEIRIGSLSS